MKQNRGVADDIETAAKLNKWKEEIEKINAKIRDLEARKDESADRAWVKALSELKIKYPTLVILTEGDISSTLDLMKEVSRKNDDQSPRFSCDDLMGE